MSCLTPMPPSFLGYSKFRTTLLELATPSKRSLYPLAPDLDSPHLISALMRSDDAEAKLAFVLTQNRATKRSRGSLKYIFEVIMSYQLLGNVVLRIFQHSFANAVRHGPKRTSFQCCVRLK